VGVVVSTIVDVAVTVDVFVTVDVLACRPVALHPLAVAIAKAAVMIRTLVR
jgi:hypothetical protein